MLQVVYIRAYVEITRLLAQYEVVIHEHSCEDFVYATEGEQEKVLEGKLVKMTTTVSVFTHKLETYKVRIQAAFRLEVQMRAHISMLVTRCGEMEATVSSLDKVRDAIHVMGVCPGLGRLAFVIPKFSGQFEMETFDLIGLTDEEIDAQANQLCEAANAGSLAQTSTSENQYVRLFYRAAESSEIMLRSIEDMPQRNNAGVPLLGTCPHCGGQDDVADGPQHTSGHERICWDPDSELSTLTKRMDCDGNLRKAVMCVQDQDYGQQPA
jgi:hypothetical protein